MKVGKYNVSTDDFCSFFYYFRLIETNHRYDAVSSAILQIRWCSSKVTGIEMMGVRNHDYFFGPLLNKLGLYIKSQ